VWAVLDYNWVERMEKKKKLNKALAYMMKVRAGPSNACLGHLSCRQPLSGGAAVVTRRTALPIDAEPDESRTPGLGGRWTWHAADLSLSLSVFLCLSVSLSLSLAADDGRASQAGLAKAWFSWLDVVAQLKRNKLLLARAAMKMKNIAMGRAWYAPPPPLG
jgi:hypothetical protein